MKIAIFGPHDRNNYGDLLFPIMIEYAINVVNSKDYEFIKYSIVDSDLTNVGAYKSYGYKKFINQINEGEIDTIIVAGGESLGATWGRLYSYISPIYSYLYENTRYATSKYIYPIVYKVLGAQSEFPFFINKKDFKKEIKVIYNSVGGIPNDIKSNERFNHADYFAIRINYNCADNNILIYPDSAIIMSDIFEKEKLIQTKYKGISNYVFFQVSKYKIQNDIEDTIAELCKILDNTKYNIVLCPIGLAKGHDDPVILKKIFLLLKHSYKNRVSLIEQPTIFDIMGFISNSAFYIGTSLHGVITAMSYGVKYLALNPNQSKIVNYILTWTDFEITNFVSNTNDFYKNFKIIDACDEIHSKILKSTNEQKMKYYESIKNIIRIIEK
ncbi:polysaccharide pyruvyl transferase family protein [Chryseobacterium sp. POL2]|uniref:polysaccharide pyruvyl transferase family protein n=1 Tax=Chryseobacterium sp. POL2 TaxID=2713414 RepID=UPI0013E1A9FF|nr:polysaccharide pyruvyl transferase family protein [Chryseobacterium sp. POL2]QIG90338.1 polysaccharide pyruvyl transferase family protein [Chryseobacterium sp. POL2]